MRIFASLAIVSMLMLTVGAGATLSPPEAAVPEVTVPSDATLVRLRQPLDGFVDTSEDDAEGIPLSHPTSVAIGANGIGPGSHLIITIPGEGTFGCTANFVWQQGTTYYLGAAGHCFLPASRTATHGPGADYNASGVVTRVCVANCYFGGQTGFIVTGSLVTLGAVAYARQTGTGGDLGNDFGLVVIPPGVMQWVDSQMPTWGGPSAEGSIGLGPVVHFGYGVVTGETAATMARAGVGTGQNAQGYFLMEGAAAFGDSGSAINTAVASTTQGLHGDRAGGVLTHLVASATGDIAGTTIAKAKTLASQAGLTITVNTTL